MKVYVYYFDEMWQREVAYPMSCFNKDVVTIAREDRVYVSYENMRLLPDMTVSEVNPEDVDLLIIPGGDEAVICQDEDLKKLVLSLNERGKYIAGICGGAMEMARFGILDGKRATGGGSGLDLETEEDKEVYRNVKVVPEGVVVDGNCITSTARAAFEFTVELNDVMGLYKDDQEKKEDYDWLKYVK